MGGGEVGRGGTGVGRDAGEGGKGGEVEPKFVVLPYTLHLPPPARRTARVPTHNHARACSHVNAHLGSCTRARVWRGVACSVP